MKYTFFNKKRISLLLCTWAIFTIAGCSIHEDLDPCKYYQLVVKVVNPSGEDITGAGDVQHVSLYIFDENKKFLEKKEVAGDAIKNRQPIELDYLADRDLEVVAFGNETNQEVPELHPGDAIEELYVKVKEQNGYAVFPDKIYNGLKAVSTKAAGDGDVFVHEVVIQEKISYVQAQTLGLANYLKKHRTKASVNTEDYSFYVNRTPNTLNYQGEPTGEQIVYDPDAGTVVESGELSTAENNVLPAEGFTVDLNLPTGEKITVEEAEDEDGVVKPLSVAAGKRKLVLFLFDDEGTYIGARMSVRDWGSGDDQQIIF